MSTVLENTTKGRPFCKEGKVNLKVSCGLSNVVLQEVENAWLGDWTTQFYKS